MSRLWNWYLNQLPMHRLVFWCVVLWIVISSLATGTIVPVTYATAWLIVLSIFIGATSYSEFMSNDKVE